MGREGGRGFRREGTRIPIAFMLMYGIFLCVCDPSGFSFVKPVNNRYVLKSFIGIRFAHLPGDFEGTAGSSISSIT